MEVILLWMDGTTLKDTSLFFYIECTVILQ